MDDEKLTLSEAEIDEIVTAHADDASALESLIYVRRRRSHSMSMVNTESIQYWAFLCTDCHQPIRIIRYVEGKQWNCVKGATFTLICDECEPEGEYLRN
jgi:hypothetical protein